MPKTKQVTGKDSPGNGPRSGRRWRSNPSKVADWSKADAESIRELIAFAGMAGGAIRFGYSRDGGAYSLGIYGDGPPYTEFVPPSEEINDILDDLALMFKDRYVEQTQQRLDGNEGP